MAQIPFQLLRQHQQAGRPAGAGAAQPNGQRHLAARVRGRDEGRGTFEAGVSAPLHRAVPQPRRHRLPRHRRLRRGEACEEMLASEQTAKVQRESVSKEERLTYNAIRQVPLERDK